MDYRDCGLGLSRSNLYWQTGLLEENTEPGETAQAEESELGGIELGPPPVGGMAALAVPETAPTSLERHPPKAAGKQLTRTAVER